MFSRRVLKNAAALMTLQLGNYLLPLILVPYLVRVLGLEVFGSWMFALAFVVVARTCVSYGFDLTATRQVALCRDRPLALSELYVAVVAVRSLIWLACLAALLAGVAMTAPLRDVAGLALLGMLILLGEILFPVWLFQGAETMGLITKLKLAFKLVNVALVVLLVKGPEDVALVPLLEAATSLAAGLLALVLAVSRFGLQWVPLHLGRIRAEMRDGAAVFLAQASVHAYTTINMIALGLLLNTVAVAQYSIAEKIYSAVRGLVNPVVQALFPGMALLHAESRSSFRTVARRLTWQIGGLLALAAVLVIATAGWLVDLVAGAPNEEATRALQVLGFALLFALGSFLGPVLVAQQRSRVLLRITVVGGLVGLASVVPLVELLGPVGGAVSFLIVQVYNSVALYVASIRSSGPGAG